MTRELLPEPAPRTTSVEDRRSIHPAAGWITPFLLQRRANCSNEPTSVLGDEMGVHTVSSRELNQDVGRAKRAAEDGPVVITDRGRPSHVLLSWAEYRRLSGGPRNLAAVLAAPALSDIPFEPEKSGLKAREVEFN